MRIGILGGGPGGLYTALLLKARAPEWDVHVVERNRADDTFGFGVVFSDETLGHFRDADPITYEEIVNAFAYWDEIETHFKGEVVRSTGHGFCGIARVALLNILQWRCASLGVRLSFETEIGDIEAFGADYDVVVAADGINSQVRERHADRFAPSIDWRSNRFAWLGTTAPLDAFTFAFEENEHGIWNVHAYRYQPNGATWIIETTDAALAASGLEAQDEAATVDYVQRLFQPILNGHPLLTNRSLWRAFPMIRCARWRHGHVVLIGDAAHTAHFSIGSGTKLAMEDAIALSEALLRTPEDVGAALDAYEEARRPEVERTQHAADVSLSWFEHVRRFWHFDPVPFNFSMLTRSKQITYENLGRRDARMIETVDRWYADSVRKQGFNLPEPSPPPMFMPFRLRDMVLANRVVVSPMCQYKAVDGVPNDWHLMHLGTRAVGGAGLVFTEMTDVSPEARISPGCAGIWSAEHRDAWARVVDFVHAESDACIALQLGHAGRKGSTQLSWERMDYPLDGGNWPILSASPLPYLPESQVPKEMDEDDMAAVIADFERAARLGLEAGFDMLEVHMAHGYLLAGFISPLTNRRCDAYGGDLANRLRFPLAVFDAVRAIWPAEKPMSVRLSANDWKPGGIEAPDTVEVARCLKAHGCDLIDVSAGQTVPDQQPVYGRMFQTPFADQVRNEVEIPAMAVGNITTPDQVNTILAAGRADLVALARPHLTDPHFTLRAAAHYGYRPQTWPKPYLAAQAQAATLAERANEEIAELRRLTRPTKPRPTHREG